MMVCRVELGRDHQGIATEWFGHDQTLALLPLAPRLGSAVLTVSQSEADRLHALDDAAFGAELTGRYRTRWGAMRVASSRHVYPLVTTYATRFVVPGAALVGDTAVGMHPVTAHGFNLGLYGAARLAFNIKTAIRLGADWSGASILNDYERAHRRACRPVYGGTNAIVGLFTDDRPPARLARAAVMRMGRVPLLSGTLQRLILRA